MAHRASKNPPRHTDICRYARGEGKKAKAPIEDKKPLLGREIMCRCAVFGCSGSTYTHNWKTQGLGA